jgi:hypothetical protein
LEDKDENGQWRYLAFYEDQANRVSLFMEKLGFAAQKWRIDSLIHGGALPTMGSGHVHRADGERSFAGELSAYLGKRDKEYKLVQLPSVGPSFRATEPDFLVSLVRDLVATKRLVLFQLSEKRTPLLLDKLQNTDLDTDILKVAELKALAHVLDDFDASPWRPPPKESKKVRSPWAL